MSKKYKMHIVFAVLALMYVILGIWLALSVSTVSALNEENKQLTKQVDEYEQKTLDWQIKAEDAEIKLARAETDLQSCSEQFERYERTICTLEEYTEALEERIKELEDEVKMLEEIIEISNTPSDWDYVFTETDVVELGAMIFAEEEGDSFCAAGAASVAGNRVRRPDFPNNFHDVIYQIIETEEHTYEQYAPRTKKIIDCVVAGKPIPKELADVPYVPYWYNDIARLILENGPIFPEDVVYQAHFKQGKGVYYERNGEYFCYG